MNKKIQNKKRNRKILLFLCLLPLMAFGASMGNPVTAADGNEALIQVLKTKTVTLNIQAQSLVQILTVIQKQTGLNFGFSEKLNPQNMGLFSIRVKEITVEEALNTLFKDSPYTYRILLNKILIEPRPAKTPAKSTPQILSGRVVDEKEMPVVGASIIVQGTTKGCITDSQGNFSLEVPANAVLEVKFLGMTTVVRKITAAEKQITIILHPDMFDVDKIVVTGYGNINRESFTGNYTVVKRDQILKASKTNVIKALQSFDPSFRIKENNQWGSDPNSLPEVYIRGESGVGVKELDKRGLSKSELVDNPNLPTFIMDGFEISVSKLYDMDPNRIESITILKDAAATALYGSRAANGVIIITTVTPQPGKLNVSYSLVGSVVAPDLSDYNLCNAAEKLEVERISHSFDTGRDIYSRLDMLEEYNAKLTNVKRGVDTYWLSLPLRNVFNHKHSLYIDGGTENLRFGVDLQYTTDEGVMKGSRRDRAGAGFYLQYNLKNVQIRNYVSFLRTDAAESGYGSFSDYTRGLPYNEYLDAEGNPVRNLRKWSGHVSYTSTDLLNPMYEAGLNNFDRSKNYEIIDNLSITWNLTKHLLFKGQLGVTQTVQSNERFYDPLSMKNTVLLKDSNASSGELYTTDGNATTLDMSSYISYNRNFEKHNLNFQGGVNIKEYRNYTTSINYRGFPSGALHSPNYAQTTIDKPVKSENSNRLVGFLAALNYSYNNVWLFDASCRFDGSSAFGSDRRFAPFWSFGAGVNLHNMEFFKSFEWLDQLKIRGSFGQTGKVNFPPYIARTSYEIQTEYWYKTGYGALLKALGNPDLTWETTNITDVGCEITLLRNLVYLKGTYYNKRTVDLVNDVTIPSSTGFVTYKDNIGEVVNRGYELDLRVNPIRTETLNLIVNANLSHNRNKITKISESLKAYNREVQKYMESGSVSRGTKITVPFTQYREGISLNSIWGMQSLGINPANGEEVYLLADGTPSDKWIAAEQVVLGCRDADIQGSFGFNLTWKRLTLYTNFMYEAGGQRYNQTLVDKVENVDTYKQNVDRRVLSDRWSESGQVAKYKKLISGRDGIYQTQATSRFVEDYNVLSFNSVTLGYDFPEKVTRPLRLSMLRVEVGANDLFHISSVKQERGLSYPYARNINFSVKLSF